MSSQDNPDSKLTEDMKERLRQTFSWAPKDDEDDSHQPWLVEFLDLAVRSLSYIIHYARFHHLTSLRKALSTLGLL